MVPRGRTTSTFARSWGRAAAATVAAAAVLAGCGASATLDPVSRSSPTTFSPVPPPTALDVEAIADMSADRAIPAAPAVFEGPPPPAAPPPAPLAAAPAPGGGVWAVIIGVDDYPGRNHDLRFARNDADAVDAALARFGVPGDRRLRLTDGQATAGVLRRAADWLVTNAGRDATAVFFFAGHVRKLGSRTEAMVGADGGLVTDAELAGHLDRLQAARTWIVVAGCYGGGFTEALRPGRILTGAAPADRLAYESTSFDHSYLVEYMVHRALLEGRADASVEAAFAWALDALRREHPDRLPVQYDEVAGDLRLGIPGPAVTAVPAPTTTAPPPRSTTTTTAPPPQRTTSDDQRCVLTVGSTIRCPKD